ncbi:BQ5605_C030g10849 [Microbotryum silenes-dioicae]|uniref:BQ5605_C030g10849 protein n=1 Tax=Microbotryum silenes-dioicae TaxID=796604 RepID=A0A2X0MI95_9BASI|nr:BQ5605_C030g10849 [Microbotryum silenes-dioicae]
MLSGCRRGFGLGSSNRLGYWWSVDVATVCDGRAGGEKSCLANVEKR